MSDQASGTPLSSGFGTSGPSQTIAATEFKAKCLGLLDEVRDFGLCIIITKHGNPAAKLVPINAVEDRPPFIGSLKGQMSYRLDETLDGSTLAEMDAWESNLDDSPPVN